MPDGFNTGLNREIMMQQTGPGSLMTQGRALTPGSAVQATPFTGAVADPSGWKYPGDDTEAIEAVKNGFVGRIKTTLGNLSCDVVRLDWLLDRLASLDNSFQDVNDTAVSFVAVPFVVGGSKAKVENFITFLDSTESEPKLKFGDSAGKKRGTVYLLCFWVLTQFFNHYSVNCPLVYLSSRVGLLSALRGEKNEPAEVSDLVLQFLLGVQWSTKKKLLVGSKEGEQTNRSKVFACLRDNLIKLNKAGEQVRKNTSNVHLVDYFSDASDPQPDRRRYLTCWSDLSDLEMPLLSDLEKPPLFDLETPLTGSRVRITKMYHVIGYLTEFAGVLTGVQPDRDPGSTMFLRDAGRLFLFKQDARKVSCEKLIHFWAHVTCIIEYALALIDRHHGPFEDLYEGQLAWEFFNVEDRDGNGHVREHNCLTAYLGMDPALSGDLDLGPTEPIVRRAKARWLTLRSRIKDYHQVSSQRFAELENAYKLFRKVISPYLSEPVKSQFQKQERDKAQAQGQEGDGPEVITGMLRDGLEEFAQQLQDQASERHIASLCALLDNALGRMVTCNTDEPNSECYWMDQDQVNAGKIEQVLEEIVEAYVEEKADEINKSIVSFYQRTLGAEDADQAVKEHPKRFQAVFDVEGVGGNGTLVLLRQSLGLSAAASSNGKKELVYNLRSMLENVPVKAQELEHAILFASASNQHIITRYLHDNDFRRLVLSPICHQTLLAKMIATSSGGLHKKIGPFYTYNQLQKQHLLAKEYFQNSDGNLKSSFRKTENDLSKKNNLDQLLADKTILIANRVMLMQPPLSVAIVLAYPGAYAGTWYLDWLFKSYISDLGVVKKALDEGTMTDVLDTNILNGMKDVIRDLLELVEKVFLNVTNKEATKQGVSMVATISESQSTLRYVEARLLFFELEIASCVVGGVGGRKVLSIRDAVEGCMDVFKQHHHLSEEDKSAENKFTQSIAPLIDQYTYMKRALGQITSNQVSLELWEQLLEGAFVMDDFHKGQYGVSQILYKGINNLLTKNHYRERGDAASVSGSDTDERALHALIVEFHKVGVVCSGNVLMHHQLMHDIVRHEYFEKMMTKIETIREKDITKRVSDFRDSIKALYEDLDIWIRNKRASINATSIIHENFPGERYKVTRLCQILSTPQRIVQDEFAPTLLDVLFSKKNEGAEAEKNGEQEENSATSERQCTTRAKAIGVQLQCLFDMSVAQDQMTELETRLKDFKEKILDPAENHCLLVKREAQTSGDICSRWDEITILQGTYNRDYKEKLNDARTAAREEASHAGVSEEGGDVAKRAMFERDFARINKIVTKTSKITEDSTELSWKVSAITFMKYILKNWEVGLDASSLQQHNDGQQGEPGDENLAAALGRLPDNGGSQMGSEVGDDLGLSSMGQQPRHQQAAEQQQRQPEQDQQQQAPAAPVQQQRQPEQDQQQQAPAAPVQQQRQPEQDQQQQAPAAPVQQQQAPAAPVQQQQAPAAPVQQQQAPAAPVQQQQAPAAPVQQQQQPEQDQQQQAPAAPVQQQTAVQQPVAGGVGPDRRTLMDQITSKGGVSLLSRTTRPAAAALNAAPVQAPRGSLEAAIANRRVSISGGQSDNTSNQSETTVRTANTFNI